MVTTNKHDDDDDDDDKSSLIMRYLDLVSDFPEQVRAWPRSIKSLSAARCTKKWWIITIIIRNGATMFSKLGGPILWSRVLLLFYRKNRQVYPVGCSRLHNHTLFVKKLCKKLGIRPNFGEVQTPPTPVVAPMTIRIYFGQSPHKSELHDKAFTIDLNFKTIQRINYSVSPFHWKKASVSYALITYIVFGSTEHSGFHCLFPSVVRLCEVIWYSTLIYGKGIFIGWWISLALSLTLTEILLISSYLSVKS